MAITLSSAQHRGGLAKPYRRGATLGSMKRGKALHPAINEWIRQHLQAWLDADKSRTRKDLAALSEEFCAPQGAVALRIGEVSSDPVALVTPTRVHRRDPLEQLPDDETLYLMARVPDVPHPIRRAILSDARRSHAFLLVG